MTVTADVQKTGNTVEAKGFARINLNALKLDSLKLDSLNLDLAEARKPLFVVAGAADLALEQAKELPAELTSTVTQVQGFVVELPTQVRTRATQLTERASEVYGELAVRGERLVAQIRRQPSTQAAVAEGKQAVAKAEAAVKAGQRAARAGEKAVTDAAGKLG